MNEPAQNCFCPLCETEIEAFLPRGNPPRPNRRCPACKSNVRSRFAWLALNQKTDLFDNTPRRLLHFAPDKALTRKFADLEQIDYVTADIEPGKAMFEMDMRSIESPDNSFDAVFCSHVLEHIDDDRKAMRELCRVLKPGGWAMIIVPIHGPTTFEDPSVTDPKERERLFRQRDHVRIYGRDIAERLEEAGFTVHAIRPRDVVTDNSYTRYGIPDDDRLIYLCIKPR